MVGVELLGDVVKQVKVVGIVVEQGLRGHVWYVWRGRRFRDLLLNGRQRGEGGGGGGGGVGGGALVVGVVVVLVLVLVVVVSFVGRERG